MKKLSAVLLMALVLAGCGSSAKEVKGSGESAVNKEGDKATAEIVMKGDEVVSIKLDETKKGKSKKELGNDYGMKSDSKKAKKEWFEQIKYLEDYIVKNGLDKVKLGDDGKATGDDILAGCTVSLTSVMEAANNAKEAAK
ncbi:hypothetical protein [Amedibacillus sp. YH-ame10]